MEKYGKIIAPGTLRFERLLPGPVEKVWTYLTDSEKRGKWLAKGEMEPFVGGKVTLHFLHAELSPEIEVVPEKYKSMECGHSFTGEVLQYEPPNLLSFSWSDNSEVTIELKEQEEKVLLILTHRRLSEDDGIRISVLSGWHTHLGILKANLEGVVPQNFWAIHSRMEKEYTAL